MAADRLDGLARVVTEALDAPVSDLAARGRAYLALLDSVLIASFVAEAPGPRWLERLDADLTPAPDDTTSGVLGLHSVARLCAHAGARVVPPPHGPIPVEWQGWRFGIVAAPATAAATHDAAPLADRIPPAVDQLRAARLPGLIVADATREVCPSNARFALTPMPEPRNSATGSTPCSSGALRSPRRVIATTSSA